jgi:hypothetical protein
MHAPAKLKKLLRTPVCQLTSNASWRHLLDRNQRQAILILRSKWRIKVRDWEESPKQISGPVFRQLSTSCYRISQSFTLCSNLLGLSILMITINRMNWNKLFVSCRTAVRTVSSEQYSNVYLWLCRECSHNSFRVCCIMVFSNSVNHIKAVRSLAPVNGLNIILLPSSHL